MANQVAQRKNGLDRTRPFASFYHLIHAGKRFKQNRRFSLLIIDGPQYLIEQGIRQGSFKAHEYFKTTTYYQPFITSNPCRASVWVWNQVLLKSEHAIINFPQNAERTVAWVKRVTTNCPRIQRQIARYEQCGDLEFVQGVAEKTESVFRVMAMVDISEFSSTVILIMQDAQDITKEVQPFLALRKRIYAAIRAAPQKIIDTGYGSPERKHNHFSVFSSRIVHEASAALKKKEEAQRELNALSRKATIVCDSAEKSAVHVFFPEAVNKAAPKVSWFVGRHAIRWYICNFTGWAFAYGVQYSQQLAGYEEDEMISHETLVATHWYAKWALWTVMLNFELKNWKAERERAPEQMSNAVHDYANGVRRRVEEGVKKEQSALGRIAPYFVNLVSQNIAHQHVEHKPPPQTIWRRCWNAVVYQIRRCFTHPHQE